MSYTYDDYETDLLCDEIEDIGNEIEDEMEYEVYEDELCGIVNPLAISEIEKQVAFGKSYTEAKNIVENMHDFKKSIALPELEEKLGRYESDTNTTVGEYKANVLGLMKVYGLEPKEAVERVQNRLYAKKTVVENKYTKMFDEADRKALAMLMRQDSKWTAERYYKHRYGEGK